MISDTAYFVNLGRRVLNISSSVTKLEHGDHLLVVANRRCCVSLARPCNAMYEPAFCLLTMLA